MTDAAIIAVVSVAAGQPVQLRRRTILHGGSINSTLRVETSAGSFVIKSNSSAPEGFFSAEADGLRALRSSGIPLVIPAVLSEGDSALPCLVLQDLGDGTPLPDFDDALGRGLAALHRHGCAAFGFARDNFCGLTPQPNPWTTSWIEFYATSRLGFQVRRARDDGRLSAHEAGVLDDVMRGCGRWIDEPADGPSLIHGDLWRGNVHVTGDGRPALIDPAVSYAHREAELGMMTLFGGFAPRVFAAYDEAFPLEAGWRERNGLYQLYHLLNHLNLFGGAYRTDVMALAQRYR